MTGLVSRLLSIAITRQDDRSLEYVWGDPNVSDSLDFAPPLTDTLPETGRNAIFNGAGGIGGIIAVHRMWDDRVQYGGWSDFPYRISGVIYADDGITPVSNAIVSLFRTSDDQWMYDAVSKDGGQYDLGVSDTTTTYYIVAYRAAPDIEGTTVNTLTGS